MTNNAATIGLTYSGTDVQQDPIGIFLEIRRGLSEQVRVRGTDTVVPSMPGRLPRARVADGLVIELEGYVGGIGETGDEQRTSFRTLVQQVRALFDPTASPADLVALLEDGSTATISARTLPGTLWDEPVQSHMAHVNIQLEALSDWDIEPEAS